METLLLVILHKNPNPRALDKAKNNLSVLLPRKGIAGIAGVLQFVSVFITFSHYFEDFYSFFSVRFYVQKMP